MKSLTKATITLSAILLASTAYAGKGGEGQNCEQGAVNQNFCQGGGDYVEDNSGDHRGNSWSDSNNSSTVTDNSVTHNGPTHNGDRNVDKSTTSTGIGLGGSATGGSVGDTSASSVSKGGKGGKGGAGGSATGGSVGDTSSSSVSSGGNANATVGNTNATVGNTKATVGNTTATGGSSTGGSVGNTSATGGNATGGSVGNTTATGGTSLATGGSVGDTSATGGSVGDTSATGGSVGDTTSESNNTNNNDSVATVGDTSSESNNVNTNDSVATVGDTSSSSDNSNSNDSEGGDVEFNYTSTQADNAAMSAASVLTGYCQNGGSAQGFNGGFSLTGNDAFCDAIRLSDHYWVQVQRQQQIAYMLGCAAPKPALAARCVETGGRMLEAMDRAWEASDVANDLLMASKFSGQVEAVTGPFARIGGILALLLLL